MRDGDRMKLFLLHRAIYQRDNGVVTAIDMITTSISRDGDGRSINGDNRSRDYELEVLEWSI
jgi:hypothetical protein